MDWQTLVVYLVLALALLYVGRRVWKKIRSFSGSAGAGCETGCGKCGTASESKSFCKSSGNKIFVDATQKT